MRIAILLLLTSAAYARNVVPVYPFRVPFKPPPGDIVITPHPAEPVVSLDQLIRMSQLIVEADVSTVLPAIIHNPDQVGAVETDAVMTIRELLSGKAPGTGQLLLVGTGGRQGVWNVTVAGSAQVQRGERYLLFLAADTRKTIPNSENVLPDAAVMPRFYPIGALEGKIRVEMNGHLRIPRESAPFLLPYHGTDAAIFVAFLRERMRHLFPVPPPYPSGIAPQKP